VVDAAIGQGPILRTVGLGFHIGGARIIDDVSLDVRDGEFVTIIGPNGAGKTSLFNLLSGLYRASSGRVELAGRDITRDPPFRRARAGLGRTFQTSSIFPALSVLENARLAAQAHQGGSMRLWRRAATLRAPLERAHRALGVVGLSAREASAARSLSHGDKRKLELAILLCGEPRVVLLDEPTAGVSVEDVPEKTVLMVEHRMDVVVGLSDRMAVMHQGALLAYDTPPRVMANPTVQAAYLGESL